jgi:hypothetical protein
VKDLVVAAHTSALDDWDYDEGGKLVAPGGRKVAEWLARELVDPAQQAPDVFNHEDYGWDFQFDRGAFRVSCLIAMGDKEGSLYFWAKCRRKGWRGLIGKNLQVRDEILGTVRALLINDERFSGVRISQPWVKGTT